MAGEMRVGERRITRTGKNGKEIAVNMRYVRRQTSRRSGGYNSRRQNYQEGQNLNGRAQGRAEEIKTSRLNPTAPRFHPIDDTSLEGQVTGNDRDRSDNAYNLNG